MNKEYVDDVGWPVHTFTRSENQDFRSQVDQSFITGDASVLDFFANLPLHAKKIWRLLPIVISWRHFSLANIQLSETYRLLRSDGLHWAGALLAQLSL